MYNAVSATGARVVGIDVQTCDLQKVTVLLAQRL